MIAHEFQKVEIQAINQGTFVWEASKQVKRSPQIRRAWQLIAS
jgi:hypothetical protein